MKILDKFKIEEIKDLLNTSDSFREFLIKINSSSNGSAAYKSIKKQLSDLGISLPKFEYKKRKNNLIQNSFIDSEVFVKNSSYSRTNLKKRIIKNGLIKYECRVCGNEGKWNDRKLSLQLEHINGINNDNRLENLEFLCPNCHTQTKSYAGKNKKVEKKCECGNIILKNSENCNKCSSYKQRKIKNRPSYEELLNLIEKYGYVGTGKKYNVSDNTIRKWRKQYEK